MLAMKSQVSSVVQFTVLNAKVTVNLDRGTPSTFKLGHTFKLGKGCLHVFLSQHIVVDSRSSMSFALVK